VLVESTTGVLTKPLTAEEERALCNVAEKRYVEFALGRQCAHRCLQQLGADATSLLPGPNGEPIWPAGFVGSITHCEGYCAAAVAARALSVGIDAEPASALPDDVLGIVAFGEEIAWVEAQPDSTRGRLLFSAKESVYKAWFPLTRSWLSFEDVRVEFNENTGSFTAHFLVSGPVVAGKRLQAVEGRYIRAGQHLLTSIVLANDGASLPLMDVVG
jgi:4'-phosphopantetheinyl transferase EntD